MTRTPLLIMFAAAAALAGCGQENHTIVAGGPDDGNDGVNAAAEAQVQLPPSIAASKSYRCKDNKIIYVDWLSDGSARVKTSPNDVGTAVASAATELKGDAKAVSITFNGQSCKA